jgi:hypothetical protein
MGWKQCAAVAATSLAFTADASAATWLSGPIDPSGKVKARISPEKEIWGRDRARAYTLVFKRVPVDCEGDAARAALQRVRFIKFRQLDHFDADFSTLPYDYALDIFGRRLGPRKATGQVGIHGPNVPLRGGGSGHCDSGTLRWKATARHGGWTGYAPIPQ